MSDVVHYRGEQANTRPGSCTKPMWWPACGAATMITGPRATRSKARVTCRRCRAKLLGEQKRRVKPLPKRNAKRKAKRDALTFGPQSELCRFMSCCACYPAFYRHVLTSVIGNARERMRIGHRISDPHHAKTRGASGRDEHCVPLCRAHHMELDSVNCGVETFERRHGIDLRAIAAAISKVLGKERTARLEDTTQKAEQT